MLALDFGNSLERPRLRPGTLHGRRRRARVSATTRDRRSASAGGADLAFAVPWLSTPEVVWTATSTLAEAVLASEEDVLSPSDRLRALFSVAYFEWPDAALFKKVLLSLAEQEMTNIVAYVARYAKSLDSPVEPNGETKRPLDWPSDDDDEVQMCFLAQLEPIGDVGDQNVSPELADDDASSSSESDNEDDGDDDSDD